MGSVVLSWLVLSSGVLVGLLVMLALVFHIDAFGWNRKKPFILPRARFSSLESDEAVLFQENGVCGAFDAIENFYKSLLQVILTNTRLIIRFVSSWRGLCLTSVALEDIVKAELVEGRTLVGGFTALVLHFSGEDRPDFFALISRNHLDEWLEAFAQGGIKVLDERG